MAQQIQDYNNTYSGLKYVLFILNLEIYKNPLLIIFGDISLVDRYHVGLDATLMLHMFHDNRQQTHPDYILVTFVE